MSQRNNVTRVLRHLQAFGSITSLEAIYEYGNTRLAATIFLLRERGYDITTTQVEVTNRFGEKRCIGKYTLNQKVIQVDANGQTRIPD
jgi:hypothetical protein